MLREIVLDTETTGTEARNGDRIIEIGCVELINHCPTGQTFHAYINPQRAVSAGALAVHGLTDAFLADKQLFADIAGDLEAFLGDARLVIHNASFDVGFLDMEFGRIGRPPIRPELVIDTLTMARRKHPGGSNSLDALCVRYGIDSSRRVKHGALLDAEILAEVYIELLGGRQTALGLGADDGKRGGRAHSSRSAAAKRPGPPVSRLTLEERAAHAQFVAGLGANAVWKAYMPNDTPRG